MISFPSPIISRIAAAASARRYAIACGCLLIVAAGLRFYDLPENQLWHDEVVAVSNSKDAFSDVLDNTRYLNSSPILYPLALWAVQRAQSTEFSVLLPSAVASALTVGALLFWMPRLGVPRRAAFLAGLLAAFSVEAIRHAQDAREYSVDALCAVLIIAGVLQYARDGKRALFCAALLAGPLLQYGLVLFGAAALAVAALAPSQSVACQPAACDMGGTYAAAIWGWIKRRRGLLLPLGAFAAACAISWGLTLRYQWESGGFAADSYLAGSYYQGDYYAAAIADFAIGRTWSLLSYHMPAVMAAAAAVVFAGLLLGLARRRRFDPIALLALFAIGIGVCAALTGVYPLGDIRQCLYLGPAVFLAAGVAFHSVARDAAALARRKRLAAALAVAAAGAIALMGAAEIREGRDDLYIYYSDTSMKQILATLEEKAQEGDAVYVSAWEVPIIKFYQGEKPANYFYGSVYCHNITWAVCVDEMLDEMFIALNGSNRIWMIHNGSVFAPKEVAEYSAAYSHEAVVEEFPIVGWNTLHLITGVDGLIANIRDQWLGVESEGNAIVEAAYSLYLQDDALYYVKQPCVPADTESPFFLRIYPENAHNLPVGQRRIGSKNVNFEFRHYGLRDDADKCVMRHALPNYAIGRIHTGQFVYSDGSVVWDADFRFKPFNLDEWLDMYETVVSREAIAESTYDVYLWEDALHYAKRPCVPEDAEARFFLYLYPEYAHNLSAHRREYGYNTTDFEFRDYGFMVDDKCLARIDLPEYAVRHIHTGQFVYPDGPVIWDADFPFEPFNADEWLDVYERVASRKPIASSDYDVYIRDDALYYAKQPCVPEDADAHFFLYIYPEDVYDLPAARRQYGYAIHDFKFRDYGFMAEDKCIIRRALPDYAVGNIHTGQYVYPDETVIWDVDFASNYKR